MPTPSPATVIDRVAVVPWPGGAATRARARVSGTPRLLVVAPGCPPPVDCDRDEDWTASSAPAADIAARLAVLETRPVTRRCLTADVVAGLSDDGITVFDALVRAAPRATTLVGLADLLGDQGDVAATLADLRRAIRGEGYDVISVPGGVLLAGGPADRQRTR